MFFTDSDIIITSPLSMPTDSYPEEAPKVVLPELLQSLGLRENVEKLSQNLLGSPMLYELLETAKEWITSHPLNLQATPPPPPPPKGRSPPPAAKGLIKPTSQVCKFFSAGKCRFGSKCRLLHPGYNMHTPDGASASESTSHTPQAVENRKEVQKAATAVSKPLDSEPTEVKVKAKKTKAANQQSDVKDETGKKVPMKTATDVISRILWDPDLPSEEFTIGYLDRFIGVMEKPFSAFSWEHISTVGASVLAIPKHRIQYFKFKDEIVWDKPSQMDNFFGSRGGQVIQDIVAKHLSAKPPIENQDSGESILREEEDAATHRDIEACIELEMDEEASSAHSKLNKDRPTHFVCFRITDARVKEKTQQIQDHIVSHTPQLADGCLPTSALHVTLCMLRLDNQQQIETAKKVLQNLTNQFIHILPHCLSITFTGVDNFHGRLVYAKVAHDHALDRFVSLTIEQLKHAGLRTPGNFDVYTPHMTLVKLSRPMQRELHTTVISPASYIPFQQSALGTQKIDAIHLCSMSDPKQDDGFYLRLCSVSNSLSGLVPSVTPLLLARLQSLTDKDILSRNECDRLKQAFQSEDEGERFDSSIEELLQVVNEEHVALNSTQTVVVLRGLPGSGKSFLSRNCSEISTDSSQVVVCAADEYFTEGDSYRFNPNNLPKAHSFCLSRFLSALTEGKQIIIIDNTNSRLWEYRIYTHLCDILGLSYHILEVPCPNAAIADMYCARNVHNIDSPVASKIFNHWEEDERAVKIPPALSHPRARVVSPDSSFSLLSLCRPDAIPENTLSCYDSITAVYTGVFLTPESQWELVSAFTPAHPTIHADHVTLMFEPSLRSILRAGIGKSVSLKVTGCVDNGKIQVVLVQLPKGVTSGNESPHVTISTESGISPKLANEVLRTHHAKAVYQSFTIEGVVGLVVRETQACDLERNDHEEESEAKIDISKLRKIKVTSESDFQHHVVPKLLQNPGADEDPSKEEDFLDVSICTGHQKVTQLFIYDFDGTLFSTPEPKQGKELYEKITGKKWEHKGWLSWPESLLPPLKSTPGPALTEYRQNLGKAGSQTMVLTARIKRTEEAVRMVLENNHIYPDKLILKPDSMDESSPDFKVRIIKNLLEQFPDVTLVKFWDDSARNLASVQRFSKTVARKVQIEIVDATQMLPVVVSKQGKKMTPQHSVDPSLQSSLQRGADVSVLESQLLSYGLLPSQAYTSAAETGLNFLASQFCKLIDFHGPDSQVISYTFGSFVLGRQSDVDVCFLAPASLTVKQCMETLAKLLEDCGVNYIHRGYSTRCPRLKVMLEFSNSPPVNYDIVFSIIARDDFFQSPPTQRLPTSEIAAMLKSGDAPSKVAFSGPLFLQQVEEVLQASSVSRSEFGAVVEMIVQVLIAQRQKGNAYHCIRTFHVVRLLADFISSQKKELSASPKSDCDSLFKSFVGHLSVLPEAKWQKLFGEFVPFEFIPRVLSVFAAAAREVSYPDFPSQMCYEEMKTRPPFPAKGHTLVELKLAGSNSVTLWKLHTIVEARLPSYVRQLLAAGINVYSDGNVRNEKKFCFAVPQAKASKHTLQQTLRPFWNEIAEYRKQSGVKIELTFGAEMQEAKPGTGGQREAPNVQVESIISKFVAEASECLLELPPSLSSYERRAVHETAERLGLEHFTVGEGKNKRVALRKKE